MNKPKKVAILTAGGLAPCLNSAIGSLIERYTEIDPTIEIICYRSGYKGLLLGDFYTVTPAIREKAGLLHSFGGSLIGNSRVKLTNVKDCVNAVWSRKAKIRKKWPPINWLKTASIFCTPLAAMTPIPLLPISRVSG